MRDAAIRAAVDHAIRRHLETREETREAAPPAASPADRGSSRPPATSVPAASPEHPSQARFPLADGSASDGRCVLEPGVACVRSGHCQAQGY